VTPWLCPACLVPNDEGQQHCQACRAPLLLGGRFVVREPLAAHGSARTLGGSVRDSGDPVVIKMLSVSGLADWKQLELFQRGIAVLRGLSHPGIPRHLGDGQLARGGETMYYWVQQRMPGRTLAAGLADGQRWTEARARALADGVLVILEYLQGFSPPILHRDLKPSNIIELPGDAGWALIDFDLVKDTIDPEGSETTALGTAGYAPLEQLMGRAVPASDLYGLGATLVAVLSRKSPADLLDDDASRLEFRAHVRVSEAFAGFLEQLLAPRVSRRPADATAARARLRAAIAEADDGVQRQPLAAARQQLLRMLLRRALTGGLRQPSTALVRAGQAVPPAGAARPGSLVAVGPSNAAVVILQTKLAEEHPAPGWVLLARLSILGGALMMLPARGMVLAVVMAAVWVVSGFVVRYPVRLAPGRALFMGGYGNTNVPEVYWLRRRWTEKAHSIPLEPLHLDWRPAPTRIEHGERHCWLELELELWATPRSDDLGQFIALLKYHSWQEYPRAAPRTLREEVLDAVVEHIKEAGLFERALAAPVRLDDAVQSAIELGLRELGLELLAIGAQHITLRPHTDDLATEDRLWIDHRPPPAA
jgi:Protein kinase domain